MDIDFSAAIRNIMPLVGDASEMPFIIWRKNGNWNVDYFSVEPEKLPEYLQEVRERDDPYAVSFRGTDFSKGSFPFVYDKVLCGRLQAEFESGLAHGAYPVWAERKEVRAMLYFFEDKIGEFSPIAADYLTTVDKPLAELTEMCPYNMTADRDDWSYDEDLASDAVHYIENEVGARRHRPPVESRPETRYADGYAFAKIQSVQIGQISIILSECANAPSPFLVCNHESGEDYSHSAFPGYLSAIREFTARQTALISAIEAERETRRQHGVDSTVLTAAHCLPGNGDFTGKTLIVKASELSPEVRYADTQLIVCGRGNGAHTDNVGGALFGTELYTGEIVCYGRRQIEGAADESTLPQWAKVKLEIMRDKEVFEYGGYHFKPVRQFVKGEVDKPLEGDSRPWKMDNAYAMRNMSTDFALGISSYDWNKTDVKYSNEAFYEAAQGSGADIFKCLENGKLYVPGANELFLYHEPPQKKHAAERDGRSELNNEPSSLLGELNDAKAEAAARNAAPKENRQARKRGDMEV